MIVNLLKLQRNVDKNPLFEILFNYLNESDDFEENKLNDLKIVKYDEIKSDKSKFDYTMHFFKLKNNFKIYLNKYNFNYMIPKTFKVLKSFPINSSDKIKNKKITKT
jgi:non-ribosomal peptide synthetase component F